MPKLGKCAYHMTSKVTDDLVIKIVIFRYIIYIDSDV